MNGRCDEAMGQLDLLRELQVPPARVAWIRAQCLGRRELWEEASNALRPTADRNPGNADAHYGFLLARAGRLAEARGIRDSLLALWRRGTRPAYPLAVIHAGLHEYDEAFKWLDAAVADQSITFGIMEPMFEDLWRDARFDRIRKKLGLAVQARR